MSMSIMSHSLASLIVHRCASSVLMSSVSPSSYTTLYHVSQPNLSGVTLRIVPVNQPSSNSLRTRVPIGSSSCSLSRSLSRSLSCSLSRSRSLSRSFVSFCLHSSLSRARVHLCLLTRPKNCLHDGHCSPLTSETARSSALTLSGWESLQCLNSSPCDLNLLSGGVEASWHSTQYPMEGMLGLYPALLRRRLHHQAKLQSQGRTVILKGDP